MTVSYELAATAAVLSSGILLLVYRHPRHSAVSRAFAAGMVGLIIERAAAAATDAAFSPGWTSRLLFLQFALGGVVSGVWVIFSTTYARTNAAVFLKRWRWGIASLMTLPLLLWCLSSYLGWFGASGVTPDQGLAWAGVGLHVMILGGSVAVLLNLERTVRAAVGTSRWRLKFIVLGVAVIFVTRLYTSSQAIVFRGFTSTLDLVNSVGTILGVLVICWGVVRAPEFTSDVYPSLSMLQGSVTITLTGIYLLVVGVFARIAMHFGGDAGFAVKAFLILVALVLLAILFQSDRIRLRLRQFVSRHFDRPLYDYSVAWRKFTEATVSRVEQPDVCRSLVKLIADTFSALSVTIWLIDEKSGAMALAASTSLSDKRARELAPSASETQAVAAHLQRHPEPADVEVASESWAAAVRRWGPSDFPHGGNRVCIPLVGRGEVLGLIVIGDRVSGVPFSLLDFDMLKCVGEHAAANLLNVQLSRKLVAAKELEAFQTMATFFVHDLKNAAWTLNLMLQNLPVHFDKPEFRADALRAIGKTATHINQLTTRLGALRHELKLKPAERDLNEVVTAALSGLNEAKPESIVREFQPLTKTLIDQEQLQKVVVNLVVNAIEASPADSPVRVATAQRDHWVVLGVSDRGCGMSEEFMRQSLFRPFQTTKKHGLGIGMFQSRMIVEAHGGRIQATSEVGQGSTFEILIPIRTQTE